MCVAAIISCPVSLDYLRKMAESNPHGGGVAWPDAASGLMRFKKGLTAEEIHALQESGELTFPYLLHFRWATAGDKVPEMTHPFPVGIRALFGELEGAAEQVLIHNGTMSWAQQKYWVPNTDYLYHLPWELINRASDTAIAAWLLAEPGSQDILKALQWATCLASVQDGQLVTETTGEWDEFEGNKYSNLHWLPYSKRPGASGGGRAYSWSYGGGQYGWSHDEEESGTTTENTPTTAISHASAGTVRSRRYVRPDETTASGLTYDEFSAVVEEILGPEPSDYNAKDWGTRFVTWFESKQQLRGMTQEELLELMSLVECAGTKCRVIKPKDGGEGGDEGDKALTLESAKPTVKEAKLFTQISQKHFDSWDEYCRTKYGDEVAEGCEDGAGVDLPIELDLAPDVCDDADMVSEDPETVNAWLARQMIG